MEPGPDAAGPQPEATPPDAGTPASGAARGAAAGAGSGADTEADALEEMGDEIARLAAHVHAGMRRYLELVAEFDRRRGWEPVGHRSCARWLAFRTGFDLRTARDHVRVARALEELPRTARSMARGRLSFSQVRAVTRVATPETEEDLLELAEGVPTARLERMVRAWRKGSRQDEAARERERHRLRRLSVFPDDDGMYVVRGRLMPEAGVVLMRTLEAAGDALYRRERASGGERAADGGEAAGGAAGHRAAPHRATEGEAEAGSPEQGGSAEPPPAGRTSGEGAPPGSAEPPSPRRARREARRRRADAMGLLAERAMAAGFGGEDAPISGSRAERYQVLLHVEPATLEAGGGDAAPGRSELEDGAGEDDGAPARSELEDGTRVAAESARRLACDAATVQVNRGRDGSVLDVGRRTRTVPPALRRALEVRDRGCRFPGCGLRFTDAHHLTHWADGGKTSLENTLLLCRRHHRLVHEEGWTVEWWGRDRAVFTDPRGGHHLDERPTPPGLPERPVEALVAENRRAGADPGPLDASARWRRERDVPDEVWFPAVEAAMAATAPP